MADEGNNNVLVFLAVLVVVAVAAAVTVYLIDDKATCSTITCAPGTVPDSSATATLCASDPCTSADQSTCCNAAVSAQTCGGKKDDLQFCQTAPGAEGGAAYVIPTKRYNIPCPGGVCTAATCCVDACSDENTSVPTGGSAALTPNSQCKQAGGRGKCVADPHAAAGQQEWMCECWAPWQPDPALGTPNCNHNVREQQSLSGSGFQGSGFDTDCRCEGQTCSSANIQACQLISDENICRAAYGAQGCIWDPPQESARKLCVGPFKDQCYSPEQRSYIDVPPGTGCEDATDSAGVPHTTFVPMHVQGCEKDATNACSPPCTLIDDPCVQDAGSDTECYFDVSAHQCIDGCHIDTSKLATCEAPTDASSTLQCTMGGSINDGICQEGCILKPGLMCNSLTGTNEATCVAPLLSTGERDPASEAKCNSINLYTEEDLGLNATVAPEGTVPIGQFSVLLIPIPERVAPSFSSTRITTHTRDNAPSLNVGDKVRVIYNSSDKYNNTIVTITAAEPPNQYTIDQGLPNSIIGNGSISKVSSVNASPETMTESERELATCTSEGCEYNAAGTSPCTFDNENNCPEGCLSQIAGEGNSWIEYDFKLSCHAGSSVTVWGTDEIDLSICGRGEVLIEHEVIGECGPGEIPVYWEGSDVSGTEQQDIGAQLLCGCWSACTDACENITSEYNQSFQHYRLGVDADPFSKRMQKPTEDGWESTRVSATARHAWDEDGENGSGTTVPKQMIDASCGYDHSVMISSAMADIDPNLRCEDPFYEDQGSGSNECAGANCKYVVQDGLPWDHCGAHDDGDCNVAPGNELHCPVAPGPRATDGHGYDKDGHDVTPYAASERDWSTYIRVCTEANSPTAGAHDGTNIYAQRHAPKMKPGDGIRRWWLGELQRSMGAGGGLAEAAPGGTINPPMLSVPPFLGYEGEGGGSYFPDDAIAAGTPTPLSNIARSGLHAYVPPALVTALNDAGGAGSTTAVFPEWAGVSDEYAATHTTSEIPDDQRPVWQSRVYIPKVLEDGNRAVQYCHSREFGRSPQIIYPPPCFGETGARRDEQQCNSCDITSTEAAAAKGVINVVGVDAGVSSWQTSDECSVEVGSLHRYPNFMDLKPRCVTADGEYIDGPDLTFEGEDCTMETSCVDGALKKNYLPQTIRQYVAQGDENPSQKLNSIAGRYNIESIKESQCQSNKKCPPWTGSANQCSDAGGKWILETPSYIKCRHGAISGGASQDEANQFSTCACPRGKKAQLFGDDTWRCVDWETTDIPDVGYPW